MFCPGPAASAHLYQVYFLVYVHIVQLIENQFFQKIKSMALLAECEFWFVDLLEILCP